MDGDRDERSPLPYPGVACGGCTRLGGPVAPEGAASPRRRVMPLAKAKRSEHTCGHETGHADAPCQRGFQHTDENSGPRGRRLENFRRTTQHGARLSNAQAGDEVGPTMLPLLAGFWNARRKLRLRSKGRATRRANAGQGVVPRRKGVPRPRGGASGKMTTDTNRVSTGHTDANLLSRKFSSALTVPIWDQYVSDRLKHILPESTGCHA
uniref:Uncharacterized protein n=1 Tax=Trichuris muris TaxID=70415 RepID=A0A5S6QY57_TRIMR